MCFILKTPDEAWDLLELLDWDSYGHKKAKANLWCSTDDSSMFCANPYSYDLYRDLYT